MGISLPVRNVASAVGAHVHPAEIIRGITHRDLEGVRVLFINMPLREGARPNNTPEGPLLLATNLRQNYGVEATVIDLNAYRIKDEEANRRGLPNGRHLKDDETFGLIQRHIKANGEPDVVGFSGKITTLKWQKKVAAMIRQLLPDVFLVSGGGLATELKAGLFRYIPEIDGIAHSEGDDVMIKITLDGRSIKNMGWETAVASGKLAPYYAGIINERHRLIYKGDRPLNLNALPHADLELLHSDVDGNPVLQWYLSVPEWSARANNSSAAPWDDEDVTPKTNSVSSRGCPFSCRYCFRGSQGERQWGVRSAEHIMRELKEHIDRYKIKFHGFPDDNFAVTVGRIKDLNNIVAWGTHTRLDEVAGINPVTKKQEDPLRVKLMADAGCKYIGFGPESASASVLEAIGKGGHTLLNGFTSVQVNGAQHEFPTSMIVGIQNALRYGIHSNCTWIIGSPTETLKDVQESILFILWQMEYYAQFDIKPESVNQKMFTMTWYPGVTLINNDKVRETLSRVFKLTFVPAAANTSGVQWEPVMDDHFERYVLDLDDATKILHDPATGEPLNFSDMPNEQFLQVRDLIDNGNTLDVLNL